MSFETNKFDEPEKWPFVMASLMSLESEKIITFQKLLDEYSLQH